MNNKKIEIGDCVYYKGHGKITRRVRDIRGTAALIWGCSNYVPLSQLSHIYVASKGVGQAYILNLVNEAIDKGEAVVFEASKNGGEPVKVAIEGDGLENIKRKIESDKKIAGESFEILGAELVSSHAKKEWAKKMQELLEHFKVFEEVRRL